MARIDWQGKAALITGAATGIGRALAHELARRGASVYVSALSVSQAQGVVDEITADGGKAVALALDVTINAQYASAIERVVRDCGKLDVLINNAGLVYVGEYHEMDEAFLEQLIRVNHTGVAIGTLYGYRQMKTQGHGLIVNVASQGGIMPVGTMAAYSGTKHAVVGLTASVAGEAEAFGVAFKTVCPGNITSELLANAVTRGTDAQGVLDVLPRPMPAERAAIIIVDGFAQKSRKIFVPWYARALYLVQRLWPEFGHKGVVHSIEQFRRRRDDTRNQR
ncbi:MAG: SDR family oxidoreductase [Gammaproteobacteria bacterium]|nr:SDR family oxidoreductase [Gammaproteobacteria bacterium]